MRGSRILMPALATMLLVGLTAAAAVAVPTSISSTRWTLSVAETPTESATPLPGLRVSGHVRLNDSGGLGLSGVRVRLAFSSYPAHETRMTDADGNYETSFNFIPGDEMIRLWAELEGFSFDPAMYYWRHWFGREYATRDFVALPLSPTVTPTSTPLPVCTPPACLPGEMLYCPSTCPGGCGYRCATPRGRIYLPVILRQFSAGD